MDTKPILKNNMEEIDVKICVKKITKLREYKKSYCSKRKMKLYIFFVLLFSTKDEYKSFDVWWCWDWKMQVLLFQIPAWNKNVDTEKIIVTSNKVCFCKKRL